MNFLCSSLENSIMKGIEKTSLQLSKGENYNIHGEAPIP